VRELTFKSTNPALGEMVKKIKELQKKARLAIEEQLENEEMKEQEALVLIKGTKPVLPDILIRPVLSGKKSVGTLECHQNGLRFYTKQGKKVDISFNNIKYAFYQPGEGDMMALLHFNLKAPIVVGDKKKTSDIQFYTEVGIQAEDIDFRRKPMNDDDEIEQEEREKMAQRKLNEQFRAFTEQVQHTSRDRLIFEMPVKELGFNGSPNRSNVFLMPTIKCLVNLTELPYFIMPIDEIEIAHFERVQFRLKNFDLSFVFKDYNKPVIRINAIPTEVLEGVKSWLE
jgi:nucleosome binding factor SPN SPT16 subunit